MNKIDFDADVRSDGIIGTYIVCQKEIPDSDEWNRVHVTLSPADEKEPDYKKMWEELKAQHDPKGFPLRRIFEAKNLSAKDVYEFMKMTETNYTPKPQKQSENLTMEGIVGAIDEVLKAEFGEDVHLKPKEAKDEEKTD